MLEESNKDNKDETTYQFVAQMCAALAVVVSLGFVAYELKLNREMAMADIYAQSVATAVDYHAQMMSNEVLQNSRGKSTSEISKQELRMHVAEWMGWMWMKEAHFFQYKVGMIDDIEWEVHQRVIQGMGEGPCFRYAWNKWGANGVRDDFASEVETIWADIPEKACEFEGWQ